MNHKIKAISKKIETNVDTGVKVDEVHENDIGRYVDKFISIPAIRKLWLKAIQMGRGAFDMCGCVIIHHGWRTLAVCVDRCACFV